LSPRLASLVLALLALLATSPARANIGQSSTEGETFAPLLARVPSTLRVDSEDLDFELDADLLVATVTATYRMSNPGAATSVDAAFVFAAPSITHEPAPSITIDGAPVDFTVTSDADQLIGKLLAWIASHPAIEKEIERLAPLAPHQYTEFEALRGLVDAAGSRCGWGCERLVQSYARLKSRVTGDEALGDIVVDASRELVPDAVDKMAEGWSTLAQRERLRWLGFRLELGQGAARTIVVRYRQLAGTDRKTRVNRTAIYNYLLSPAKSWASFGPLHIAVHTPPDARIVASSLPLPAKGRGYEADLATLPDGELTFDVMSVNGVWLGMTTPSGYWAIIGLAMAAATGFIGTRLGRAFSGARSGCAGSLLRPTSAAALCMIASVLIGWILGACMPPGAMGFGYGPVVGLAFLTLVSGLVGGLLSVVVGRRARA
jgi:hypothetical protein